MGRIDQETVRRILDTADIVEVVSDFVSLRRRGANYLGLCPFHNERTPSFSVSPRLQMCKCFSCGESCSAVGFIMKHESMTYPEALRYLAKKYNIEIKEAELTPEQRQADDDRQAMLALNEWALQHFEHNLTSTDEGQAVGLSYFRQRGISDAAIAKFHLGYSPDNWSDLTDAAQREGFDLKYLTATGLTIYSEGRQRYYDRYRARVIYPIHSLSGKVVGFGGRILHNDKKAAKYVNSPESVVYTKNREVYGLFQAKKAIAQKDRCILVEGYMDVISMSQRGIENVVSSSGTSLTEGQIALIRRFTPNVTVIYDSDAAGIKASLRGIDMLLAAGLSIKVVLLPEGDDPDSFAQAHTTDEIEQYLADNSEDFITFKINILLADVGDDPMARAGVINDIIRSVAAIPDGIARQVYIKNVAERFAIEETAVSQQVTLALSKRREEEFKRQRGFQPTAPAQQQQNVTVPPVVDTPPVIDTPPVVDTQQPLMPSVPRSIVQAENDVMRYLLRYGFVEFLPEIDLEGNEIGRLTVVDCVSRMLADDDVQFSDPTCRSAFDEILSLAQGAWPSGWAEAKARAAQQRQRAIEMGQEQIARQNQGQADINARMQMLTQEADEAYAKQLDEYAQTFIPKFLASSPSDDVRALTAQLVADKHTLSKVHSKYAKIETERDRLDELVPRAVYVLKGMILEQRIKQVGDEIRHLGVDPTAQERLLQLMAQMRDMNALKARFAEALGERIIAPKR